MSDMSITVGRVTYLCCQFCSYKTRFTGNLAKHVRTHTGERPFECYFCGKRFASKSNYNTHIVTHTGPNGTLACPVFGCPFQTDKGSRMHWHFKQVHIDRCTETNLADVVRNVPMVTSLLPNNRSSPRLSPRAAGRQLSPIGSFLMPNISAAGFSNSTSYSNSSMYGITGTSETQNGCASKSGDRSHPELTPSGSHSSNRERIYDFAFPITNYAAIENGTEEEVEDVKPNIYTLLNYLHANSNKALLNSQRNIKIEEVEEKRPSEKNENESSSRSATTPSRPPIVERDQDRRTSEGLNHDKEPAEENKQNGESGSTSDDSKRAELFPANFIDNLTDVHTQMLIDSLVKESRLYRCDLCNILFPEYSVFVLHVGCHGNDSAFQCHFCRETFSDKFGFLSHFIRCPHELKNC